MSSRELELIDGVVKSCSELSRAELAHTVCELLGWRRANGALRALECRAFLERLEAEGALKLLAEHAIKPERAHTRVPRMVRGERGALTPIALSLVLESDGRTVWRELVGRITIRATPRPTGRTCAIW